MNHFEHSDVQVFEWLGKTELGRDYDWRSEWKTMIWLERWQTMLFTLRKVINSPVFVEKHIEYQRSQVECSLTSMTLNEHFLRKYC